jgi:Ca2+-dependent lipid-binding protein
LKVTVVKAENLKNQEAIGKSDPYVKLYVRVLFKEKTSTIGDNLNPVWNQEFLLDVEDTETQALVLQIMDEDVGSDKQMGIASIPLNELVPDTEVLITQKVLKSLDTARVKDKGDRGTITVKLKFHPYTEEEQEIAILREKEMLAAKEALKNSGVVGGAMDAVGGGVKLVGTGISTVGSTGVKLVGTGVGAVGSGVGMVGSGVVRAGRMMSSGVKRLSSSSRLATSVGTPVNGSPLHEVNGTQKVKEV